MTDKKKPPDEKEGQLTGTPPLKTTRPVREPIQAIATDLSDDATEETDDKKKKKD